MNLVELQKKIHQQNKDLGWWDEERPFSTFACLFHSELSEAMEGDRKGLMDDHLPQYPMFQVELADFVIRCLDWLGSKNSEFDNPCVEHNPSWGVTDLIAALHGQVSDSYNLGCGTTDAFYLELANQELHNAVNICFTYAKDKFDLYQIILEKVEYNKTRPDHKRKNRAKEGGKKY